jgi:hypothetical protein
MRTAVELVFSELMYYVLPSSSARELMRLPTSQVAILYVLSLTHSVSISFT